MKDDLPTWLIRELNLRAWSHRELGRRIGRTGGAVSNVINRTSRPTMDFCTRVARALGVPVDDVLVLAGLKAPMPAPVAEEAEVMTTLRGMTETERQIAVRMLRAVGDLPPEHGVNERGVGYGAGRNVSEFYEVAEQLAGLPDGPIRNEAMSAIQAIARNALERARERDESSE